MADLTLPSPGQRGELGHVQRHADLRTGLQEADNRLDALEEAVAAGLARVGIIVAEDEPDHDGSQEDGDLWVKKQPA